MNYGGSKDPQQHYLDSEHHSFSYKHISILKWLGEVSQTPPLLFSPSFKGTITHLTVVASTLPVVISIQCLCVGCKAWIYAIHGLRCAKLGFTLCTMIHGLSARSMDCAVRKVQSFDLCKPWNRLSSCDCWSLPITSSKSAYCLELWLPALVLCIFLCYCTVLFGALGIGDDRMLWIDGE